MKSYQNKHELETIDGLLLRNFILNERPHDETLGNVKKVTFMTIFTGILKQFLTKTAERLLFPFATLIGWMETMFAFTQGVKKRNNRNGSFWFNLSVLSLMTAVETAAVVIALGGFAISAMIAPIMFLSMTGYNFLKSIYEVGLHAYRLWTHRHLKFSAYYQAEKEALKQSLIGLVVSGTLVAAIFATFFAPVGPAAVAVMLGAAKGLQIALVAVLGTSLVYSVRNKIGSLFTAVKQTLGYPPLKKVETNVSNPPLLKNRRLLSPESREAYINGSHFKSLTHTHIDDLLLRMELLSEMKNDSATLFLTDLINAERNRILHKGDETNAALNEAITTENNLKLQALGFLSLLSQNKSVTIGENTFHSVTELIKHYRTMDQLETILKSRHEQGGMQKIIVLVDHYIHLESLKYKENITNFKAGLKNLPALKVEDKPILKEEKSYQPLKKQARFTQDDANYLKKHGVFKATHVERQSASRLQRSKSFSV